MESCGCGAGEFNEHRQEAGKVDCKNWIKNWDRVREKTSEMRMLHISLPCLAFLSSHSLSIEPFHQRKKALETGLEYLQIFHSSLLPTMISKCLISFERLTSILSCLFFYSYSFFPTLSLLLSLHELDLLSSLDSVQSLEPQ